MPYIHYYKCRLTVVLENFFFLNSIHFIWQVLCVSPSLLYKGRQPFLTQLLVLYKVFRPDLVMLSHPARVRVSVFITVFSSRNQYFRLLDCNFFSCSPDWIQESQLHLESGSECCTEKKQGCNFSWTEPEPRCEREAILQKEGNMSSA